MTLPASWLEASNHQLDIWTEHLPVPVLIGRLNYEVATGVSYFEWTKEARQGQLALSPLMMPLNEAIWSSRGDRDLPQEYQGLPGLLNDALPDGWGLYLMDKALARLGIKPEFITPAVRLAYLGDRAWGSLTFRPVIEGGQGAEMSLEALGQGVEATIEGHLDEVSNELLKAGSSPQGARPKVMVDLSDDFKRARVTTGSPAPGYRSWLIKFASRDEPADAPIIEQAYMVCACEAGLDVMDSRILDINGKPAFATERFDRTSSGRVFCHSLGGLIHFSHREMGLDYANVAQVLDRLMVPEAAYQESYRRAVFNAVMSVRDDHAKNFAFMLDRDHQWNVAPAYDLTYMEGPGGYHSLTFAEGAAKDPARADLLRLAAHYHVEPEDAAHIIEAMLDVATRLGPMALGLGASRATVAPIIRRLEEIARPLSVPLP